MMTDSPAMEAAIQEQVVTTEQLRELIASGSTVYLPEVVVDNIAVLGHYSIADQERLDVAASDNPIVSVEYVGEEEVQCIRVADEDHLYITDDFIPTHNTSNIVFLKSTDDSMIETLEKMSGKTHRSYIDSKQISQDLEKVVGGKTDGRVSYTATTKEEPLIAYNDMAFLPERNSIVFRAGDPPVWNRNETILPMSWRLFQNTITHPGNEYSLQTIPTLSSASDFDVPMNQPDFTAMLEKRMQQAWVAADQMEMYKEVHGYQDLDIERLDPDVYAEEVMNTITYKINDVHIDADGVMTIDPDDLVSPVAGMYDDEDLIDNIEVLEEASRRAALQVELDRLIYAEGTISKAMLVNPDGSAKVTTLDQQISEAYRVCQTEMERDRRHFTVGGNGELRSADGKVVYLTPLTSAAHTEALRKLNNEAASPTSRVYSDGNVDAADLRAIGTVQVHSEFYQFLASLPNWGNVAAGEFDRVMAREMNSS